ncbi:hypothetical protein D9M68_833930 [compost metagenome]
MVINPVEQQSKATANVPGNAQQHQQLTEQLEQRHRHATEKHHHSHALHVALIQPNHTTPNRILGRLTEQAELHDRQEIGWNVKQQGRKHQGQATSYDLVAMRVKLIAAARTLGSLTIRQRRPAHQEIAFMTGNQLIQWKRRQVTDIYRVRHKRELALGGSLF